MGWGMYPESMRGASLQEVAMSMYVQGLFIIGIVQIAKFIFPWLPI